MLLIAYVAGITAISWTLPQELWPSLCTGIVKILQSLTPSRTRALGERLHKLLGVEAGDSVELVRDVRANVHMRNLQYLRVLRPGGWRPNVRVDGREHIDAALSRGSGVILWSSPLIFGDLVTKVALAASGIRASHLSYYSHGFSPTRFGYRVLNPIVRTVENRFLAERLVMTPEEPYAALRELAQRVRSNRVVSISAVVVKGQRSATVPFFAGMTMIATGAPQLARRTGAALLPVFTVRTPDGSFRTTVEAPIDVTAGDRNEAATAAVRAYAQRLEPYVARWPDQYAAFGGGRGLNLRT
jgi:lauroyl/myristoyl acyltransferase